MKNDDFQAFESSLEQIFTIASSFGLDFYEMRFELVPAEILYTFGAYQGMPTRFSHWSFGKAFYRMKMDYDLGLSKIYELVINSDPCYAFLLDSNTFVQNQMVSAHVLAHCDFFKNNALFLHTSRDVVNRMAASADRFHQYEMEYGKDAVERFLDAVMAIQEHIDPTATARNLRTRKETGKEEESKKGVREVKGRYDDLLSLDKFLTQGEKKESSVSQDQRDTWEKDLLFYLIHHSPILTDWQRDILTVLRDEMLYFWPQLETKIMNEG